MTLPRKVPPTWMVGVLAPAVADRCRLDHSWSGPSGAQDCQAAMTRSACAHGQDRKNSTIPEMGWVVKVNEVATPKLPPPPPRQAQNRSGSRSESQVRIWPSAVTTWAWVRLSLVSP